MSYTQGRGRSGRDRRRRHRRRGRGIGPADHPPSQQAISTLLEALQTKTKKPKKEEDEQI